MANEAVLMIETHLAIPMECAEDAGIEKGACVKLADPFTVSLAASAEDYVGGITKTEKISGDGKTKVSVYRGGIFKVMASGSITAGQTVTISGTANKFVVSDATCVSSKTWGIALETVADGETFLMELRPGVNANAYS
jgi:hypothetical protein